MEKSVYTYNGIVFISEDKKDKRYKNFQSNKQFFDKINEQIENKELIALRERIDKLTHFIGYKYNHKKPIYGDTCLPFTYSKQINDSYNEYLENVGF